MRETNLKNLLHARVLRFVAVAVGALVLAAGAAAPAAAAANDPMGVVKVTVNDALRVLRDKQTPLATRQQKLRDIVSGTFDFAEMSRSAMGFHWRQISPDQQKEFTKVFITFIENSYLAKINEYSGQQVQFLSEHNDGPQYAVVKTNLVQQGKDPISIDYRLLNQNGQWKIYDVTVDAISIIANYRNQFNRVMNNKGYATLISDLKAKEAGLAASMGS
jgi:phospholipid transport system substrate-binding protein